MRLVDLQPRWFGFGENPRAGFVFLCPHCRKVWLSCKSIALPMREQMRIFSRLGLQATAVGANVVPTKPEFAWSVAGDFESLTVTPSIDASPSGDWHGHITAGAIVGGL